MDCRTAQSLINAYIQNELKIEQLEQFLKHVEHCPSCYDELEANFIVRYALRMLDDDDPGCFDMSHLMEEDIARKRRKVKIFLTVERILVLAIIAAGGGVALELMTMLGIFLL